VPESARSEPRTIAQHGDYECRTLDLSAAGIDAMSRLLRAVFPRAAHLTPPYLDWLYGQNPVGRALGWNACLDGEPVGHYVLIPLFARLFGAESRGAHSLNGAVHPDHQGRGLYARLGELAHASAREAGLEFLIGVPNANSTHVFVHTFGFQLVGPLQARLGFGPIARNPAEPAVDYARVWDERSVRWRLANPSARYSLRVRGGRGEVRAPSGRAGIRALLGWVDPAFTPPGLGAPPPGLDLFIGADPALRWSRSLYVNLPMRLRPAPLNFVFKDLAGRGRRIDPGRLRYAALDFDPY
jgi:GNAT superfamily N-acetyltransferase